jgi:hypothetical protein
MCFYLLNRYCIGSDKLPENVAQDTTVHVVGDLGFGVQTALYLELLLLAVLVDCRNLDDLADFKMRLT